MSTVKNPVVPPRRMFSTTVLMLTLVSGILSGYVIRQVQFDYQASAIASSAITSLNTIIDKPSTITDNEDPALKECIENDPNPFLVELRKQNTTSSNYVIKQTCTELVKGSK